MAQKTDNPASPKVSMKADPMDCARRLDEAIHLIESVYYDFPELEKLTDGAIARVEKIRDTVRPAKKGNLLFFPAPRV